MLWTSPITPLKRNLQSFLCSKRFRSIAPGQNPTARFSACHHRHTTGNINCSSIHSPVYRWHEEAEDLEPYAPGGYHPTHIGDRYDNRYEVVHKLGAGSYSTVWLAKDHNEDSLVALKMIISQSPKENIDNEIKALQLLARGPRGHPGQIYVPRLRNRFTIDGPNGSHHCIVTDALGGSVSQNKDECSPFMFSANVARAISAQALLGLDYIHSCGIVHGDLHSNNILFPFPCRTIAPDMDAIYRQIGEPTKLPIERYDGQKVGLEAPRYCVPPAFIGEPCDEISHAHIVISDFGEAFFPGEYPKMEKEKELHTPTLLLPPEYIFNEQPINSAVDIWSLGCTLVDLLGRRRLFEGVLPDENDTVAEMISTLGPLPTRWWDCWQKRSFFFHENGSWKENDRYGTITRPLRERITTMGREGEFDPRELLAIEKLVRNMLIYEPSQRISAKDAVSSEWMQIWGIPSIEAESMKFIQQES